jgi:hypothetical protein
VRRRCSDDSRKRIVNQGECKTAAAAKSLKLERGALAAGVQISKTDLLVRTQSMQQRTRGCQDERGCQGFDNSTDEKRRGIYKRVSVRGCR